MARSERILMDRELGELNISIGTSLAIEGAFGVHPEAPVTPPPIMKYSYLWINVSTLFRNVFASLTSDDQDYVIPEDIADAIISEMSIIDGAVQDKTNSQTKCVFYINDIRAGLDRKYPKATIKIPTTPRQVTYQNLHDTVCMLVSERNYDIDLRIFKRAIEGQGSILILTHYSIDLLCRYNFDQMTLLESHTGKIKPPALWGSKLGVKDETLPFNIFMVQLFGDGSTLFMAKPIKYRRPVLELAKQDRWSPITTIARIKQSLDKLNDVDIKTFLIELTRTY